MSTWEGTRGRAETPPPPCMDCAERSAECHASCGRYAEWAEALRKAKARMAAEYDPRLSAWRCREEMRKKVRNYKVKGGMDE